MSTFDSVYTFIDFFFLLYFFSLEKREEGEERVIDIYIVMPCRLELRIVGGKANYNN